MVAAIRYAYLGANFWMRQRLRVIREKTKNNASPRVWPDKLKTLVESGIQRRLGWRDQKLKALIVR